MSRNPAITAVLAEDVRDAKSISFVGCEACRCGKIHIRLHDEHGVIFAVASMFPPIAALALEQLKVLVEASKTGGLESTGPEGTA